MIAARNTLNVGGVGCLRNIKSAMAVARAVLERTSHSLLVGEKATQFAVRLGFTEESLTSAESQEMWTQWRQNNCQPNFWVVSWELSLVLLSLRLTRTPPGPRSGAVPTLVQLREWTGVRQTTTPSGCWLWTPEGILLPAPPLMGQSLKFRGRN